MELIVVCRARWAVLAWMHAVDEGMELFDSERYAYLDAQQQGLLADVLAHPDGGPLLVREVIGEAYSMHLGTVEVAV